MFRSSPRVVLPRVSPRVARLLLALLVVHGFSGPFPACLFFHGHLARVSSSLQFTPLGLKANGVDDHCKRRRSGHRIDNLLSTLNVKDLQKKSYDVHAAFKHTTHCTSSHGLPNIPSKTACQASQLKLVIRILNIHVHAGVPTHSNS